MNLRSRTGTAVHSPAKDNERYSLCEPVGASRGGYVSPLRPTNEPVTCKRCIKIENAKIGPTTEET